MGRIHGHRSKNGDKKASRTYSSYASMINRCYNFEDKKDFPVYGGRGIAVCERWRDSFVNFLKDMGERPPNTTLNRKDPNGHYEPGNCIWSDFAQQAKDRRSTRWIEFRGHRLCCSDWAKHCGVHKETLRRLMLKKGEQEALIHYQGRICTSLELAPPP